MIERKQSVKHPEYTRAYFSVSSNKSWEKYKLLMRKKLSDEVRERASEMLNELETFKLNVVLVPAERQNFSTHMIRVADEHNPQWYKKYCEQYPSSTGRTSTIVRRPRVISALKRIIANEWRDYVNDKRLIAFIELELENKKKNQPVAEYDPEFPF